MHSAQDHFFQYTRFTMKVEAAGSTENLVHVHQTTRSTWSHIAEDNHNSHLFEGNKSHDIVTLVWMENVSH
jgi:hypothetical protein